MWLGFLLATAAGAGAWGLGVSIHRLGGWTQDGEGDVQLEPHEQAELEPLQSQPDMLSVVCVCLSLSCGGKLELLFCLR